MWPKTFLTIVTCTSLVLTNVQETSADKPKVTDRQYASMPVLFHLDDYDRCMLYGEDCYYCMTTFQIRPVNPENASEPWKIVERLSSHPSYYRHDRIRHGVCITETCPNVTRNDPDFREKFTECYDKKFEPYGVYGEIVEMHCEGQESPYPIDIYHILYAGVMAVYLVLVIFASFYEGTARYKTKEEYDKITGTKFGQVMAVFSIPKNWYRLKTVNMDNPDVQRLRCIQGVRFYNMVCVIMTHTVMVNLAVPVSNPQYTETMTEKFLNMFLANGGYAVQTFFMISGWLLTYHFLVQYEGKKEVPIAQMIFIFINRYIRLTPTLAIMIFFNATWLVHLSRGPFWDALVGEEYRRCRENGWTNLLYINNYVNRERMCLQQSWYLATDTQLFVVALVIIYLLKKIPNHPKKIFAGFSVVGILIPFVLCYINDYDIIVRQYPENVFNFLLNVRIWHLMYTQFHNNITGYTIGIFLGYLYYNSKEHAIITRHKKIWTTLWWILTFGIPITTIMVAYIMYQDGYQYTRFGSAIYWALGRNTFAFGIALLFFGFSQNIGWFSLWFSQWAPAVMLGRLTFTAYIIHLGLIKFRTGFIRAPVYNADYLLCLPQTWYMAIDTQFFLLTLILLSFIIKNHKRVFWIVGTLIVFYVVMMFTIVYWNDFESTIRPYPEELYRFKIVDLSKWHVVLGSNYGNLIGVPAGLTVGYAYYKLKDQQFFNTKLRVTMWWVLVWGGALGIIMVPGWYIYHPDYVHDRLFASLYQSVNRPVFVFALGLGLLGVSQGIGWMTRFALEWPPTYIVGRLTYNAYLVQTIFVRVRGGSNRHPQFLSDGMMFAEILADICQSYLAALVLTLVFETPISAMQSLLIPQRKPRKIVDDGTKKQS